MTLGNMRQHGVRSVEAACEACKHEAAVNVDSLADHIYVPDVALMLRCCVRLEEIRASQLGEAPAVWQGRLSRGRLFGASVPLFLGRARRASLTPLMRSAHLC